MSQFRLFHRRVQSFGPRPHLVYCVTVGECSQWRGPSRVQFRACTSVHGTVQCSPCGDSHVYACPVCSLRLTAPSARRAPHGSCFGSSPLGGTTLERRLPAVNLRYRCTAEFRFKISYATLRFYVTLIVTLPLPGAQSSPTTLLRGNRRGSYDFSRCWHSLCLLAALDEVFKAPVQLGLRTTAILHVDSGVFWSGKVGHTPRARNPEEDGKQRPQKRVKPVHVNSARRRRFIQSHFPVEEYSSSTYPALI
ncbi:hypothetical protein EVAR_46050_1 [Eumeta japonica]|uniref:Uncharacterized protein n=1 Tax=Eumeta variegata TaxID=151549 RepID=A0A4C1XDN6_EUMVA|nr:hypothetical protein EVAR_46050_1 [Eumeta japonica]